MRTAEMPLWFRVFRWFRVGPAQRIDLPRGCVKKRPLFCALAAHFFDLASVRGASRSSMRQCGIAARHERCGDGRALSPEDLSINFSFRGRTDLCNRCTISTLIQISIDALVDPGASSRQPYFTGTSRGRLELCLAGLLEKSSKTRKS